MSQLAVAVVVPVYNRATQVIDALQSIARQTRKPQRVIVVDDGSTDGGGDAVDAWARRQADLSVLLIRQSNQGASLARNRAAEEARDCPLLAFLDSDDLWPPDYLRRVAGAMEREPAIVAASIDQFHVDAVSGASTFFGQAMFDGTVTPALMEPQVPPVPSCTIIRTAQFHELGGFDPAYVIMQDRHFFLRLSLLGPWRFVAGAPMIYRRNHGGAAQLTERFTNLEEIEKWWAMTQRFIFEQGGDKALPAAAWRHRIAAAQTELGEAWMMRRQFARAIACFNRALENQPDLKRAKRKKISARLKDLTERLRQTGRRSILRTPCPTAPRVAVVLPVYCRENIVTDALDCALRQTHRPAKLIVVDDGSTDGTARRVEAWIAEHRGDLEVSLIRQPNAGTGAARNRGAEAAGDCDLLAFLDSDDLWPADFLKRASAALAASPDAVAAHADLRFVDAQSGDTQFYDQSIYTGWITRLLYDLLWRLTRDRLVHTVTPIPVSTVVRAEAFHRAGGFDPRWRVRSDMDFNLRLSVLGPWVHVPGEPAIHRRNLARVRGGAGQLTEGIFSMPQRIVGWQLLAFFLTRHGRAARLPVGRLRRELARQTAQVGGDLVENAQFDQAALCLEVAQRITPRYHPLARARLRRQHALAVRQAPAQAPVHVPAVMPLVPPRPPGELNPLDCFHIIKDRHLDKQWGAFLIPIDSERNDTLTHPQPRNPSLYFGRYSMPFRVIEGWFGYWSILDDAVAAAGDGALFVELGAAWGCATVYLASKIKAGGIQARHVCVDRWPGQADFERFEDNLRLAQVHARVQAMRMSFEEAARHFEDESIDFVFIDGGHEYEDVTQDIHTWWPKVKPGGVMAGDDWCETWPGVERAVREALPHARPVPTHFWLARKG